MVAMLEQLSAALTSATAVFAEPSDAGEIAGA
jgi:hypothetical protein